MSDSDLTAAAPGGIDGVVLLGHGSRAAGAQHVLEWVAERLAERLDCPVVAASLQFNQPTLEESCRLLAAGGASQVVVAPYFLFEGNHMKIDIPGELAALERQLPGTRFILASPLGADERLVEVVLARVVQAAGAGAGPEVRGEARAAAGSTAIGAEPAAGAGLPPHPIERQSFDIIDSLLGLDDAVADPEYEITRRVIHATGDLSLVCSLAFSPGAAAAGRAALSNGANIICDVNMVAAGAEPSAGRMGLTVRCAIADEETARTAAASGITRGAAGLRRLAADTSLDGAVVVIGNAPTALFEVLRLVREEGARPALVIGVPVGFVGASESKEALVESGLPYITLPGNRGGSNIAVAIVNAIMRLASAGVSPSGQETEATSPAENGPEGPSL